MTPRTRYLLVAGVVASIIAVAMRHETLPLPQALLALAITWVGATPGIVYLQQRHEDRAPFPLMALSGFFYAVFFGLPGFIVFTLIGTGRAPLGDPRIAFYADSFLDTISLRAQLLVFGGTILMFSTWALTKRVALVRFPRFHVPETGSASSLVILGWALALGNIAYYLVPALAQIPSIGQFLQPAGFAAFACFYTLKARGALSRSHALAYFFVLFPVWMVQFISGGLMTPIVLIVVLWVCLRVYHFRTVPWIPLAVFIVSVIVAYPHIASFRASFWGPAPRPSVIERFVGFAKLVGSPVISRPSSVLRGDIRPTKIVRRVSLILPLSHVVETTPDRTPYWGGATYRTIFVGWVPRFLWKSKPEERWGNAFGRRYGILLPDRPEYSTMSVNLPWVTEMFANFGWIGVVIGMSLAGAFLGVLDRFLNFPNPSTAELSVSFAVLLPLFYQESNFTLMTGSIPLLVLCFWLYFYVGQSINNVILKN